MSVNGTKKIKGISRYFNLYPESKSNPPTSQTSVQTIAPFIMTQQGGLQFMS
jgi:hypothetical protein